jgi:integrase
MKQLNRTKVTVRIRKAVFRDEWYLSIESYPVFEQGKSKSKRIVEALNRTVTSIVWDKKRTARTTETSKTYKPKRDENGIIMCRTEKDQEACIYADGIRKLRQREYDNADLYSDNETAHAEQKERSQQNFIEYFDTAAQKRHVRSSESIRTNWKRTLDMIKLFKGDTIPFSKIDNHFAEDFKMFLMTVPCGGNKSGTISQNTAATYFSIFKAGLKQAFVDGYLTIDLSAKIKGIQEQETRREFLTVEELNTLAATPCDNDQMKRAALFSALTGLRHCDIQKMQWKELQMVGDQARLNFTQQKTKGVEYMPISPQALELCGKPQKPNQLVFEDLPDPSWISRPLKKWLEAAGITKKITFHTARHSYASVLKRSGANIAYISESLGHSNLKTTENYLASFEKEERIKNAAFLTNFGDD